MMHILREGLELPGSAEEFRRAVVRIFSQVVEVRHLNIKHLKSACFSLE